MIMSTTGKILNFRAAVRASITIRKCGHQRKDKLSTAIANLIMHSMFLRLRPSPKMDLLLHIYLEKYLELPSLYRGEFRPRCQGNCNTQIYEFSPFTSGSRRSRNSVQSYCKTASNDKRLHDFGSI